MKHSFWKQTTAAWLLMAIFLFSCSSRNKVPKPVLSHEKMVSVLVDVQLTEAYLTNLRGKGKDTRDISEIYYERIFEKHQIDRPTFDTSIAYYMNHLEKYYAIYEDVVTELNKMDRRYEQERKKSQSRSAVEKD
jgi:hypothetical protein